MKPKYNNNTIFSQVIPTDKLYFSIGEVAAILDINASTIRFWDAEIDFKLQKNNRNDRRFRYEDIENLQIIMHLKQKGFNIEGIRIELKNNKIELKQRLQTIKSLNNIKDFFVMLRNELKDEDEDEVYSAEKFEQKFGEKESKDSMIQSSSQEDAAIYSSEYLEEYTSECSEEYQEELIVENNEKQYMNNKNQYD